MVLNVVEEDIIKDFNLQLAVGEIGKNGAFNAVTESVTIGQEIRVKLQTISTNNFKYTLITWTNKA